jgi:hypothetical protein
MQAAMKFTILDSETVRLSDGSVTVELSRGELIKLCKYPALIKELQNAVSNGLLRRPFEKTNLTFSKKGAVIKLFELSRAQGGVGYDFVLRFYERSYGSPTSMSMFQIYGDDRYAVLESFLEWIRESVQLLEGHVPERRHSH